LRIADQPRPAINCAWKRLASSIIASAYSVHTARALYFSVSIGAPVLT